jgi:hypothetical protein
MAKIFEPLYAKGGEVPLAFKCLMESDPDSKQVCGMVEATAAGMERHLAVVHNFRTKIGQ